MHYDTGSWTIGIIDFQEGFVGIKELYYQRRALNAMVSEDWSVAETFFKKMMQQQVSSLGLRYNLGLVYLAQEKFVKAEAIFLSSVDSYGKSLRLCRVLGDLYFLWGKRDKSLIWYQDALMDAPEEKEERLIKMRIKIVDIEKSYQQVLAMNPLVREARSFMDSDYQKAKILYEQILAVDPTNIEAMNNLGSIHMNELDDPKTASSYFSQVLDLVDNQAAIINLKKARNEIQKRARKK
jgi:tetratricopeptide (TPR) repeat protein